MVPAVQIFSKRPTNPLLATEERRQGIYKRSDCGGVQATVFGGHHRNFQGHEQNGSGAEAVREQLRI